MRWTHGMRARLRLLRRGAAEERMDEEIRFHVEMETEKNLRAGMSPREARRRALVAFGAMEGHKERMRDGWTLAWAGGVSLDLKLGVRMLRKHKGLTLIGGLAMAFAIWVGASTFEFLNQVAHPTLPLPDGARIVGIRQWDAQASGARKQVLHDFTAWREQLSSIDDLGAFRTIRHNLGAPGVTAAPVEVAEMTASGFRVARVPPLLGRTLVPDDERPEAPPVVVIGHDLWRTRFGGDARVVGRTVRLGSGEATVVGVMPEGFAFPVAHNLWSPLRPNPPDYAQGQGPELEIFGRLAPGASLREAQAELAALGMRAAADHPRTHGHLRPQVMPYARSIMDLSGGDAVGLMSLNLFLVLLLVLVCGNVALLMFTRAATREGEIIVRNALGASRGRIVAQLFTEALVLAAVAAVVGLAAARFGLKVGFRLIETGLLEGQRLPFWFHAGLSPTTVLYTVLLAGLSAVVAGVVPALKVTRGLGTRLRQATAGGGGFRFGGMWTAVIVMQVAVTVLLPVMALFTQRDAAALRAVEVGFAEEEYLSARLEANREPPPGAPADTGRAAMLARYGVIAGELERRLEADPAVAGVTFADVLPRMYHPHRPVQVDEGRTPAPDSAAAGHRVSTASVAIDYFDVLGAPILAGRGFRSGDPGSGAPVVVVNQSFVRRVLDGRNPLGRRIRLVGSDAAGSAESEPWHEIVGVVGDLGMEFGDDPRVAGVYHPVAPGGAYPLHVAVRVRGEPESFAPGLRAHAAAADPALQLHDVLPMDELSNAEIRFLGTWFWVIVGISALAVLLALAGIYAVMAFTVAQRTREIGIRVALGADARRIVAATFRRPLTQVAGGILAGGILTALLPSMVGGALTPGLAAAVAMNMVLMTAVCLLACIVPTRRALRIEPMDALRME